MAHTLTTHCVASERNGFRDSKKLSRKKRRNVEGNMSQGIIERRKII